VLEAEDEDELGGGFEPPTNQTSSQLVIHPLNRRTLIGVAGRALVGLWPIITLVQALITTCYSNSVVGGEEPSLLRGAWIGLPDFSNCVVTLRNSSVESKVGAGYNDRARSRVDIPSSGSVAVGGHQAHAIRG